ncbi:hypothetical protein BG011_009701 [Mortierella polycephala]|uniref:Uncharacterized protein n=1 Tax=Mortierella polycephala TaxID=41804 RepID=A0A9P6QA61_9FUNG|nr:hypothetical protein BG011_009701 [Mortierella polycephala]
MDAPRASNDYDHASAFQTRDRIPRNHNESKIPVSKTRRATGESVSRPKPAHTRSTAAESSVSKPALIDSASSATSAPRPIPKSNNKRAVQSGAGSTSYSFDDVIVDPFLPSTPPTFTPSMKPTGAFKPIPSKEPTSSPKSTPNTKSRKTTAPSNPAPAVPKPFSGQAARSRNVSVSSLTRPNHDDMILPAVARRIKEQGLHEHNVIAYSDDYDAPLYKRPPSPKSVGNPFAGYDRAKAASSASLGQQQHQQQPSTGLPVSSSGRKLDSGQGKDTSMDMDKDEECPVSPVKKDQRRERKDDAALLNATNAPAPLSSTSNTSSPRDTSSHAQNERLRSPKSRQQPYEQQQEQSYQQQQQQEGDEQQQQQQQQQQHEQQVYPQQQNSNSNSPTSSRPERPQRARRNTERQAQQEFAPVNDGYAPRRTRRPTAPENYEHVQGSVYSTQYQESDSPSQRQHQGRHNAQHGRNEDYSQQAQGNDSRSRRYAGNNQAYPAEEQWQGQPQQQPQQQQQSRYQPTRRHDDYSRTQDDYNYQQTHHQEDYGRTQDGYNHQQTHSQEDYSRPQDGYNNQHTNANYQNYGAPAQTQQGQIYDHSRHHQSKPEMVQVEMSEMGSSGKEGETTEIGESNNDPKDKMKKKGAVCCVVM